MSYTKLTDFAAKDALLSGNPSKLVRGTELGAEFDAIEVADALNIKPDNVTAATGKTTPVDADLLTLFDSASTFSLKKLTWANLKATVKTYFDTLYARSGANTDITSLASPELAAATATTQTATDNSTKVATTAFVRSVGPSYGGITGFSANTTLTSANYGNFIYVNGTFTLTLPVADAANIGRTITCYGYAAASVTVATQSSQLLYYQGTNTATSAVMIGVGDTVTFVNYNGTAWMSMGANALGIGQTWQSLTGSRALGVTYYNTTGKPILVSIGVSGSIAPVTLTVGTTASYAQPGNSTISTLFAIVPPGGSYICTYAGSLTQWSELR